MARKRPYYKGVLEAWLRRLRKRRAYMRDQVSQFSNPNHVVAQDIRDLLVINDALIEMVQDAMRLEAGEAARIEGP